MSAYLEITSQSEEDTVRIAGGLARDLMPGAALMLHGPLGAGKSVLARAIIRALADDEALAVPSPTFTLVQTYETPIAPVWHFDLYRLEHAEDVYELGWEDAIAGGILIVEWAERLGGLLPRRRIDIDIAIPPGQSGARILKITKEGGP